MATCDEHTRVMLVDDAEALRFALGRVLRLYGFDVHEATDGQDALRHVAAFQPQVVLTDLMMPVMDGVELIRQLHAAPETASIPVLALTANITEEAGDSAREAGAFQVLAKPVDLPQLLEMLRDLPRASAQAPGADVPAWSSSEWTTPARAIGLGTCSHMN